MKIEEVIEKMEDAIKYTSCVYPKETPEMLKAIKELKADLLESYKAIVDKYLSYSHRDGVFTCIHCFNDDSGLKDEVVIHEKDCIVNKSNKYIEESK